MENSFESENFSVSDENETEGEIKEGEEEKNKIEENDSPKLPNSNLIKSISHTLESILANNKNLHNYKSIIKAQSKQVFSANTIPEISIEDYLIRIQTYSNLEKSTLIIALILIDRLCHITDITLTFYNIHRILFSAILISIKYNEDIYYDNNYYSTIAGVKSKELKLLEYRFLQKLNFMVFVNNELYKDYENNLENYKNQ